MEVVFALVIPRFSWRFIAEPSAGWFKKQLTIDCDEYDTTMDWYLLPFGGSECFC